MQNKNNNGGLNLARRWILPVLLILCTLAILTPVVGTLAKYVMGKNAETEVTAALFYTKGDYVQKIESEGETVPEINASGWKDDIFLTLYNYEGDNVAEVDLTYSYTVSNGWSVEVSNEKLEKNSKNQAQIRLIPSASAKQGDKVEFSLTTAPFAVTMKVTFVLADSNLPDFLFEDKGAYTLLTVCTNDYEGGIEVQYDNLSFAPDTTNPLMADWNRADGTGKLSATEIERFTKYELRFFEEIAGAYTFTLTEEADGVYAFRVNEGENVALRITLTAQ